ncbi:gluconate 2-dehydrogenase subunit 3 family protein [Algoriphagus sediminis]|uniref:Gluconate 2-dehydrogenase subunit 3 family protein n=1 Tax=Algoriphagus sediminis TaxID=3057113 RepID=A0ABT7YFP0_9BACT|nr:gluconate 2-dehydrogenase subunit 3 family protein [Algoriphagus sediminis]MDN3205344.1 gluconate 2-dehydrogenase subunit 3 family protein [Algoriphagus sediminis]
MNRRDALKRTGLLGGIAAGAPGLLSLLQACSQQTRSEWVPEFLSEKQARFITSFVDTILPKTETPGAIDVKTDMFIDFVYAKTLDPEAQAGVRAELDKFDSDCEAQFGKVFADLGAEEKRECLMAHEKKTAKFNRGVWGTAVGEQEPVAFYRNLKSMALWGYFSSEEIGKNVLNYDPIPGQYRGCVPVDEIGKVWSL